MGKRKKKRHVRIFEEPEHEHFASIWARRDGVNFWDELDQTWDQLGFQPWEREVRPQDIVRESPWLRRFFTSMASAPPEVMKRLLGDTSPQKFTEDTLYEYMTLSLFHRAGHHVFRLWPALCHALMATELRTPRNLLKLPFWSFYLQFPTAVGQQLTVDNRDGTAFPADGAYVSWGVTGPNRNPHPEVESAITVKVMSRPVTGPTKFLKDANFHYYFIPVDDDEILDMKTIKSFNKWQSAKDSPHFTGPAIQLVLNAVLYINSVNNDVKYGGASEFATLKAQHEKKPAKEPQKRARRAAALVGASRARQHSMGSTLRIPTLPGDTDAPSAHTSWTLGHRVQVRGHWRQQAYGPGRADRKTIWIQPFWKGPEMGEIVAQRTYDVVTPEGKAV